MKISVIFLVLLYGFSALVVGLGRKYMPADPSVATVIAPTTAELITAVNTERTNAGVPALTEDPRLDGSAQTKANDMQTNGYGHVDPSGKQGYEYAKAAIPECYTVSENLGAAQRTSEAISEWLGSPDHKAALLDSKYALTGFGIAAHEDYFYIVEHFCEPQPPKVQQPVQQQPSALCEDGTPSYSQSRSGTCSHHGGVAQWYY